MKPAKILRIYLLLSCVLGFILSFCVTRLLKAGEIELNAALILPVCWNVIFMLLLPLVLDWSEQKYFKARFLHWEEFARSNPELKKYIETQCAKLAVPSIKLAVLESTTAEPFSYGLWRYNPRLIVPSSLLVPGEADKVIPSIEVELARFAKQELSIVFLILTIAQIVVQQIVLRLS